MWIWIPGFRQKRTDNLGIKSPSLYQLSHACTWGIWERHRELQRWTAVWRAGRNSYTHLILSICLSILSTLFCSLVDRFSSSVVFTRKIAQGSYWHVKILPPQINEEWDIQIFRILASSWFESRSWSKQKRKTGRRKSGEFWSRPRDVQRFINCFSALLYWIWYQIER